MRAEIRQKLVDGIPEIQNRVYEPHAAGAKTEKPYLVIIQGTENVESSWSGEQTTIEIWPYVSRTTFKNVDDLADKIVAVLDRKLIVTVGGEAFTCIYTGPSGEDYVDEEWDAITRRLQFHVISFSSQVTTDPDPIVAINNWVQGVFPQLQLDPSTWVLTDETPAIYWRIANLSRAESLHNHDWMEVQMVGHVMARTASGRLTWIKRIVEALAKNTTIIMSDGSPMFLQGSILADSQGDPLRAGQIRLTARYGVLHPETQYPELTNNQFTSI